MAYQYADIIIDISHEKVDRPFQYRIPAQLAEEITAGTCVTVPFGKGTQEIRTCCLKILDQMQILNGEEVLEKYPHQLSGGMLQRIMIGIAMALQPELLIADEPTTAIDAVTQYEILEEFVRIKKNKNTACFSSPMTWEPSPK